MISFVKNIDWTLFFSAILVSFSGLITMHSFVGKNGFFDNQILWIVLASIVFFVASSVDWQFLRHTKIVMIMYFGVVFLLSTLFILGRVSHGATSWFSFGGLSFQPVDIGKIVVIIILAKYFSRRHLEIRNIRHIVVSAVYVSVIGVLVLLQPDFGSAVIIFLLWFAMVFVSGISKKHLFFVFGLVCVGFLLLWVFVFKQYQKDRISNFIHPLANIRSSGYNAYQSTIAVGSGQFFGKGVGFGTQSRLQYLPEYQTDFVFAAFAEEWGFVGSVLLFILFGIIFFRMLSVARNTQTNFDMLFCLGLSLLFIIHASINIGTNIGLLPVTGNTLPFMSYGGSHLLSEFLGLGILVSMGRKKRATHREKIDNEIVGIS